MLKNYNGFALYNTRTGWKIERCAGVSFFFSMETDVLSCQSVCILPSSITQLKNSLQYSIVFQLCALQNLFAMWCFSGFICLVVPSVEGGCGVVEGAIRRNGGKLYQLAIRSFDFLNVIPKILRDRNSDTLLSVWTTKIEE